jgi:excisionase family DNA binding protein
MGEHSRLMVLDVDPMLAQHIAVALARYFPWARDQGLRPPKELLDLAAMLQKRDRACQGGTTFDTSTDRPHADAVPLLVTKSETAAMLGVSTRTVSRLAAEGRLEAVKVAGSTRFRRHDVLQLVEATDMEGA